MIMDNNEKVLKATRNEVFRYVEEIRVYWMMVERKSKRLKVRRAKRGMCNRKGDVCLQ